MARVDIVVVDFDNTLFKRNHGLIRSTVDYLEDKGLPIAIITYRAENQYSFILDTISQTKLNLMFIGFAESREKDPHKKARILKQVSQKYNVVEAIDDDPAVLRLYHQLGIEVKDPSTI